MCKASALALDTHGWAMTLEALYSGATLTRLNEKGHGNGFPGGSVSKASACNVGDPGLIPGSGRSPGEGNGNPLQHSCLENPMDGGA